MLLSTRISRKIAAAVLFVIVGLSDSVALSVSNSESIATDEIAATVVPEVVNRAYTEVQIRRLRALLISGDQSNESTIYERLERLQSRSGSAQRD